MAKTAIGVDFGHAYVKIAELVRVRGKLAARKLVSLPVPAGALSRGRIVDYPVLLDALNEPVHRLGLRGRNVVLGLTSPDVLIRNFTLPPMPEGELRDTIRWELLTSSQFGGQEEDLTFDYSLANSAKGSEQEILVVATKRSLVEEYYRLLVEMGLPPRVVDLHAFSLPQVSEKTGRICFVDIGFAYTEVYFLKNGEYGLFRLIPIGGSRLIETMARGGITGEVAEAQLNRFSFRRSDFGNPALSVVLPVVQDLFEQLHQTLEFLRAQARVHSVREAVDEIVLSGGVARLDGLAELMSEELGCPVSYLDPGQAIEVDAKLLAKEFPGSASKQDSSFWTEFAGCLGLAKRGLVDS